MLLDKSLYMPSLASTRREKCLYLEFFWSVIFGLYFSSNEGKYGAEKLRIRTLFKQCYW